MRFLNRVSDVPLVHSTTSDAESRTWPYTCKRTCCSAKPSPCSSSAYRSGVTVELDGQRARAAAEVDDPAARHRLHQGQEVEEGLPALGREALVLLRVPGVGHPDDPSATCLELVWVCLIGGLPDTAALRQ